MVLQNVVNHQSDYFPQGLEDEETNGNATRNGDTYRMSDVFETMFDLVVKLDENKIHDFEELRMVSFPINMSEQEGQKILGIREGSVKAFWNNGDGTKTEIINIENLPQPEFVQIQIPENSTSFQIQLAFNDKSEAGSFEFEFKVEFNRVNPYP